MLNLGTYNANNYLSSLPLSFFIIFAIFHNSFSSRIQDPHPSRLTHTAGELVLPIGWAPWFLPTWASPQDNLNVLLTRWLLSPVCVIQEIKEEPQCSYQVGSEGTHHHFCQVFVVTQVRCDSRREGLHKGVNTRRLGSLGAILGAGYDSTECPTHKCLGKEREIYSHLA